MAWQEQVAIDRIRGFITSVPEGQIVVEDFRRYLNETRMKKVAAGAIFAADAESLLQIPRNRAITTNGVHVYANLINFNSALVDAGRETEASHRRALEFLHAHYSACDELISEFDMQRVDFHGSRLHAVVLAPEGQENEGERVRIAIAFAAAFREMVVAISDQHPEFETPVRIGIDTGPAVAIDGGKRDEPEPLFIGSPANHAAKLASGEDEGVFLSLRAQALAQIENDPWMNSERLTKADEKRFLAEELIAAGVVFEPTARLEAAIARFEQDLTTRRAAAIASGAVFHFHHMEPPLKNLDFKDHPPSNAVRMALASIFGDIDGFTAYIDNAIRTNQIAQAVANLHVIRAEMAAVLRDDFGGRKVRFIGDCIHGLIAEGDARGTNEMETMRTAVMAAAALRSSFELCRKMLTGADDLGLAIGIDFGETPICRLGLRGAASVRSAASRATCISEAEQQGCSGIETALGERGYHVSPAVIREVFTDARTVPNLTYENAEVLLGTMQSPYLITDSHDALSAHVPEHHAEPMRAHTAL